jgi:uncharacterized membrane protein YeaQ/YmgE (transglycosylase-associated protein family)
MAIVIMLLIGLVVGSMARMFMLGQVGGVGATILLGLGGSFLAGLLGRVSGWYRGPSGAGVLASVVGAVLLLVLFRAVMGRPVRRFR